MGMRTGILLAVLSAVMLSSAATAKTEREARIEDLEFAKREYVLKSAPFVSRNRDQALHFIDTLEDRAGAMTPAEFLAGVLAIPAFARNGHDSFDFGDKAWLPALRLPYRVVWFDDALVIARGTKSSGLVGAQIVKLDGWTVRQLAQMLSAYQGGTADYRRWNMAWVLIQPELLHAIGIAKSPDHVTLDLILADGRKVQRVVEAVSASSVPHGVAAPRFLSPQPYDGEAEHEWSQAIAADNLPIYLQDPESFYRRVQLEKLDALYVQFRANFDEGDQKIAPFVEALKKEFETTPPKNLILDERFNTGGDITQTRDLIRAMAHAVSGHIYVLIGPYTFSAGIVSAAAMKHDAGAKVTLIGAPVGDRLRFWSESHGTSCMPNSDYCLNPTTGRWDLIHGCKGESDCYGDQFDARVKSLAPDILAPIHARDWFAKRDPAMEAVERDIARRAR